MGTNYLKRPPSVAGVFVLPASLVSFVRCYSSRLSPFMEWLSPSVPFPRELAGPLVALSAKLTAMRKYQVAWSQWLRPHVCASTCDASDGGRNQPWHGQGHKERPIFRTCKILSSE